jgi:hypothetical protein
LGPLLGQSTVELSISDESLGLPLTEIKQPVQLSQGQISRTASVPDKLLPSLSWYKQVQPIEKLKSFQKPRKVATVETQTDEECYQTATNVSVYIILLFN